MGKEAIKNRYVPPEIEREQKFRKQIVEIEKSDPTNGNDMGIFGRKFQIIMEFPQKEKEIKLNGIKKRRNELDKNYGSQKYSPQLIWQLAGLDIIEGMVPVRERIVTSDLISTELKKLLNVRGLRNQVSR